MKTKLNRRKFFALSGFAAIGTAFFTNTPLKYFDRTNRISVTKKVKLHPDAVKRTK
ncbi:MAG: hypothetical protein QY331_07900 [Melioribacteraceae bacterium]|nr:MAG: hypothetical protein QY331_07900 [Melioribacteraceae bacterium]